jgi:AcrR family transcriptional regulator
MSKSDAIVAAAEKRFRYYGVGKTTMQEIAADAGVAVGTLYLYFNNKDDLVVACADTFVERHRQQIASALTADTSGQEKLRQYIVARFREVEDVRISSRHAAEIARAVLRVKPDRIQEDGMMMWQTSCEILKFGIERGDFKIADVEQDAKMLLFAISPFFPSALAQPIFIPAEKDLLEVVDWFIGIWQSGRTAKTPPAAKTPRSAGSKSHRTRRRPRVS